MFIVAGSFEKLFLLLRKRKHLYIGGEEEFQKAEFVLAVSQKFYLQMENKCSTFLCIMIG